jgi:hypothetical protein
VRVRRLCLRLRRRRPVKLPSILRTAAQAGDGATPLEVYHRETTRGSATIHLRRGPGGGAELFVNANQVYRLNPTAAMMAGLVLAKADPDDAVRR